AKPSAPCFLSIHAHVELRNLSFLTRRGLGDARHFAYGIEHAGRGEFEAGGLRSLHVHRDGPPTTAEDRLLPLDLRTNARNLAQLSAQVVLNREEVAPAMSLR